MQPGKQIIPDTFSAGETEKMNLSEMRSVWNRLPRGVMLRLTDGSRIRILDRGVRNTKPGPDFLHAEILLRGKILRGAIELHSRSSELIRDGHPQKDSALPGVILHVAAEDDSGADAETPPHAFPIFLMKKKDFDILIRHSEEWKCCRVFPFMDDSRLRSFFMDAGMERIRKKSEGTLVSMIAHGSARGFLERLFSAAGYRHNTLPFNDLLKRFLKYPEPARKNHFRAILWGESGLLPDPVSEILPEESADYAGKLWKEFWDLRLRALPRIEWRRDSVRPVNTPERRLAMLCIFLERFTENPLPVFSMDLLSMDAESFRRKYLRLFRCSDPFWDFRFTFRSIPAKRPFAVSSASRALTFLVDVLVPSLLAYAKLHGDNALEAAALRVLEILPATESNAVFRNALKTWFPGETGHREKLFSSAVLRQGCLHISQTYCAEGTAACGSCPLANSQG